MYQIYIHICILESFRGENSAKNQEESGATNRGQFATTKNRERKK